MHSSVQVSKANLRKTGLLAVCASALALLAPAALHASPITYNLTLTASAGSLYGGTGTFTIEGAPVSSGVSTYTQAVPTTIDSLSFLIDGQNFTLAGASNTIIQFINGSLTDITFSEQIGSNPYRFALHTTSGYAFYYNNELSASYGTFSAAQAPASPVPEPGSMALLTTGLLGGVGALYRRYAAKRIG